MVHQTWTLVTSSITFIHQDSIERRKRLLLLGMQGCYDGFSQVFSVGCNDSALWKLIAVSRVTWTLLYEVGEGAPISLARIIGIGEQTPGVYYGGLFIT